MILNETKTWAGSGTHGTVNVTAKLYVSGISAEMQPVHDFLEREQASREARSESINLNEASFIIQ